MDFSFNISRICTVLTESDMKKPVKNHFIFFIKIFTWLCQIEKFYELLSGSAEIFMEKIENNFSSKSNINQRRNFWPKKYSYQYFNFYEKNVTNFYVFYSSVHAYLGTISN